MTPVEVIRGDGPVVLGQPHCGTWLPRDVECQLNENGRRLADTDWHIERLYDDLLPSATVVRATFHRYLVDANRNPEGHSLYPGQNTTGLCPITDFDGRPIWQDGKEPSDEDVEYRRQAYHAPYHSALAAEIERVREKHGVAILYDCHSIRSRIPHLFDGTLPQFSIGTNGGVTCARSILARTAEICAVSAHGDHVIDGRFRGGWTTRHYGQPERGIHAIQMELAQRGYLSAEAPPWAYATGPADDLRETLADILRELDRLGRSGELRD